MTKKQFWMKMDQICETKRLSSSEKEERMAQVLKTAYDENLNILGVFNEFEDGKAGQLYVNLDEENPLTVGNRFMLCYTCKNKAIHDTHVQMYPDTAGIMEVSTRDMLNNVFNKRVIGGLLFNRYLDKQAVIVKKEVLEKYIQGEKPLPPNFVDTPMPYPLEYPRGVNPSARLHELASDPVKVVALHSPGLQGKRIVKKWYDMTEEDKQNFYRGVIADYNEKNPGKSWSEVEEKTLKQIDETFDDALFFKMSPDDQIDGAYARKEFGNKKPSLIDYILWTGRFVTHSDDVEFTIR